MSSSRLYGRFAPKLLVGSLVAASLGVTAFAGFYLASRVGVAESPEVEWTTSTLPKASDTKGFSTLDAPVYKGPIINDEAEIVEPEYLGISELCALAERSPSGEGLVFGLFRVDYDPDNPYKGMDDDLYESLDSTLRHAIETQPCSEKGNEILMETIPFITEAEG